METGGNSMKNKLWMYVLMMSCCFMLVGCGKEDYSEVLSDESYTFELEEQPTVKRELYFLSSEGYVVPNQLLLPVQEDRAVLKQALEYLVEGGPIESLLPSGLVPVLPVNTTIRGLNITEDETLIIDFSADFLSYDAMKEKNILEAITYTATSFHGIERIKLWVEGEEINVMPKQKTIMTNGYSRAEGINVLKSEAIDYLTTTPVTMYYPYYVNETCYFIPTTAYVPQDINIKEVVIQSLINGPGVYENVSHIVEKHVNVMKVAQTDDLITVTLSDEVLTTEGKLQSNILETMVLTLTEFDDVKQVQLKVEGIDDLTADQSSGYVEAMTREDVLNPTSL